MQRLVWLVFLFAALASSALPAKPLTPAQVPEPLKPWISWVLEDHPEQACPFLFNSFEQKRCSWPTETNLNLSPKKGTFTSRWLVYAESWISLPGDSQHWPLNVTVNNQPALVMDRNGTPSIKLAAGQNQPLPYEIKGEFLWDAIPDNFGIPQDTGLINLSINGLVIPTPTLRDGQLWLKESEIGLKKPESVEDSLDIQVFRKITDEVPLQVLTRLVIDISGSQREIKLGKPLLDGFIPLTLTSQLPARLEPDGQLLLQVRPGRWQIDIDARNIQELKELPLHGLVDDWPKSEVWVFEARPNLRVVEIDALDAVDASQTNLPDEWKNLPAYRINENQAMVFKVIRRGDPEPEPNQLTLKRKLWLDFNGEGYSVNDQITGKMTHGWRLNALPDMHPGKVTLDGNNQVITEQPSTHQQGVEVRQGNLTMDADSRIVGPISSMSAVGWDQNFHGVSAELNLPPGWRLLAANGVDNVPDSWLSRWTLLDLFLVLIAALATGRIWNFYWGGFALLSFVLIWHEAGSPHFVWLNILAATALIKVLPESRIRYFINSYRLICWLALVLIIIPFMVNQVRTGLYPQLEVPRQAYPSPAQLASAPEAQMPMAVEESVERAAKMMKRKSIDYLSSPMEDSGTSSYPEQAVNLDRIDPTAKVQTGPGLPEWQWHKIWLTWNGSVDAQQQIKLWYLSPTTNMLLHFLRVIFIALLALLMFGLDDRIKLSLFKFRSTTPLLLGFLLLPLLSAPTQKVYADYPSEALLTELKTRMQEVVVPDCLPACAEIQQMHVTLAPQTMDIKLQIHAQEAVTLPLPADYSQWFPNQVLDNGQTALALYRDNNNLWISLKSGEHQLILRGATPLLSKFTLPLPLKPKRVTIDKNGWEVVGLQENGLSDEQLQFSRINQTQTDKTKPTLEPGALPAFVRVERTVQLGLDWRVSTQVIRVSPPDSAIVVSIPLLPGEAVTSPGVRVKEGRVEVNIPAQQAVMQWESTLAKSEQIALTAPTTNQWIEVWRADVSPIWHVETTGIAVMHNDYSGQWLPEWHPWPGETVRMDITRPAAIVGQTLTIDESSLLIKPGQRLKEAALNFTVRSSQGTQHTVTLPENAALQSVAIDARSQPIRLQGRKLTLPINPGKQKVAVTWHEPVAIAPLTTTPAVDLGVPSVNTKLSINLGQDRWVLWAWGPRLGPAVLFWSVLIVIFLLSLGLGKIRLTPLKSWQWFLLLIGLSQIPIELGGVVIGWLMLLGWRVKRTDESRYFNELQVLIALLTLLSLGILFFAVAQGLLSSPDMRITGNESTAFNLNWYQDRSLSTLPTATVISVPLLVYRLLMLAWSLWLAVALLDWLKWGWTCFSNNGLWKKKVIEEKPLDSEKKPDLAQDKQSN